MTARREFVDDLLVGGTQSLAGLVERAALFGISLAGPHAVIVVEAERPFTDSSPLTGILERSILGSQADADALVTTRAGQLVVAFAAPDRSAIDGVIADLAASLPAAEVDAAVRLRRTAAVGAWRMGVGRPHEGPSGIRLSFEQAREALDLGARMGGDLRVLDAADLLMHRVLIRDRTAMRELVEAILAPLTDARGGAEPHLRTLEAFFDSGGNASQAARAMHLSVRALTYRLEKIALLTGRDPAQPEAAFRAADRGRRRAAVGVATAVTCVHRCRTSATGGVQAVPKLPWYRTQLIGRLESLGRTRPRSSAVPDLIPPRTDPNEDAS